MEKLVVQISNRHVHLNKDDYDKLFDDEMIKVKDLNQIGEFVSDKTVTLKTDDYEIQNVKVLGPLRNYSQVEISQNDARKFKLNPPVRKSGDVQNSEIITLQTQKGSIQVEGCIIAQRHIHMTVDDAKKYNVVDNEQVNVYVSSDKSGVMDAYIKISDNGFYELHIDTDDANAFRLNKNDIVHFSKK